jgi:hypothetical protein
VGVVVICDGIISDGNSSYEEEEEIGRGYSDIIFWILKVCGSSRGY